MPDNATPHYVAAEWPHGLRCPDCDHLFTEGETYHKRLESMLEDGTPICLIVCADCAIGVAA